MLDRLKGVFRKLQDHEVKYLVIGGIAAVLHGVPRATFDLDIPDLPRNLEGAVQPAGGLGCFLFSMPRIMP